MVLDKKGMMNVVFHCALPSSFNGKDSFTEEIRGIERFEVIYSFDQYRGS